MPQLPAFVVKVGDVQYIAGGWKESVQAFTDRKWVNRHIISRILFCPNIRLVLNFLLLQKEAVFAKILGFGKFSAKIFCFSIFCFSFNKFSADFWPKIFGFGRIYRKWCFSQNFGFSSVSVIFLRPHFCYCQNWKIPIGGTLHISYMPFLTRPSQSFVRKP